MADDIILSNALSGFIPANTASEIIANIVRGSIVMSLAKTVSMNGKAKMKFPVLVSGPGAYWVDETERISTSGAQWIYPEMEAKKVGTIIPMSKEALNDSNISVFESLKAHIAEAFAVAFDKAAVFGVNTPYGANKSIIEKISAAGNTFLHGSITDYSITDDISEVMGFVEDGGFDVNGFAGAISIKTKLRNAADKKGNYIFTDKTKDAPAQIHGQPLAYARNGAWDNDKALLIAGNWDYVMYGVLQGIEYEILKEATLLSVLMSDGKPMSLAENDMVALKATMRIAYMTVKDNAFAALT